MKKSFFIFLAVLGMTVQGMAQEIMVPAWEKFVRINKDGVNLRKAPNAQSARLMVKEYEVECTYVTELSWTAGNGKKPFYLSKGQVVPVIDESGQWYHVFLDSGYDVYIRRDYCTPAESRGLTIDENTPYFGEGIGQAYKVKGNNDLYIAYYENEVDGSSVLIGKPFGTGIVWRSYDGLFEYLQSLSGQNYGYGLDTKISKISDTRLKQFMQSHKANPPFAISYQFWGNQSFSYIFNIERNPLRKVSEPEVYTIRKFVVSASGQNLQMFQKPSPTAPKLVFVQEEEQTLFKVGCLDWESSLLNRREVEPASSKVFAVVGEVGDWYQVYDSYNYSDIYSAVGYIPKKDVKDATVMPLTETILCDNNYYIRNEAGKSRIFSLPNGEQCVVTWGCPRVGICVSDNFVNIGRIRNNIALMNNNETFLFNESTKVATIGKSFFIGSRIAKKESDTYWSVDFSKLTTDDAQQLLRDNTSDFVAYAYVNIDNKEMHIFELTWINERPVKLSIVP